jgi:hypothetical protein
MTALLEKHFGMRRLKVVDANFRAWDVRRDSENRDAAAMAIEQPIDEMQVTGATAATAYSEFPRQMSLGAGSESRALLVSHMDPFD